MWHSEDPSINRLGPKITNSMPKQSTMDLELDALFQDISNALESECSYLMDSSPIPTPTRRFSSPGINIASLSLYEAAAFP